MAFKIITDSASDIPKNIIDEFDLHVIPTPVVIDGVDYFDGENIFPWDFYDKLTIEADIKTYHINAFMFKNHFEQYAKNGDEVLYICFSTGIAGTFNAARIAKEELIDEYPDFKITIIDSKCASMGFGLVVYKLLTMQKNGASKETIIEASKYFCQNMQHLVTVETLDYLYKGGRLSKVSFVMGGALDIKPLIDVDEKGSLRAFAKVRGRKKAFKKLLDLMEERGEDLENQVIGIVHGNCEEDAKIISQQIKERFHVKDSIISYIGCAIGAHIGPGTIGIVFSSKSDKKYEMYL